MLGKKGQEAAPFELLIAVIIMGFVIFVGMKAMSDLQMQKCYGETDAKLEELKTRLEVVVTQRSPQTVNFNLSGCFNPEDETIIIKDESEPQVCASYCGAAKRLCTLLKYYNEGEGSFSIIKCLNISPETVFPTGGRCPQKSGMSLVDFKERIEQGHYQLINKTKPTDTFPTVCAYMRES